MAETHKSRWHDQAQSYRVRCTTMKEVLESAGLTYVDFFSLDVEGGELDVLRGFPWETVSVGVLLIETLDSGAAANEACREQCRNQINRRF